MENNSQNHNECHTGGSTRRDFLSKGTYAAAGMAALSLFEGRTNAQVNTTASNPKPQASGNKLDLISPTFETSPTYLATYKSSDRAKKICKDALPLDTLYSAVYPLQWKNDDQFDPVMDDMIATGFNVLGICSSADVAGAD